MTIAEVQQLFAYNRWANDRVLNAVSALSKEQFSRDLAGSFPSVAATLAHILAAEWVWLGVPAPATDYVLFCTSVAVLQPAQ